MPRKVDTSFVDSLSPSFAQLFLDRVASSGSLEAYRYPKGSRLGVRHLAAGR